MFRTIHQKKSMPRRRPGRLCRAPVFSISHGKHLLNPECHTGKMSVHNSDWTLALPPEFQQAADPSAPAVEPPKVMLSLPIDADIVALFPVEGELADMQRLL